MTIAAILSVFAGMLLGIRFKVLAIMPVMLAAMVAVAIATAAQDNPLMMVLAAATLSAIGVQIGYLCGSFVPFMKEAPEAAPAVSASTDRHSNAGRRLNGQALLRD